MKKTYQTPTVRDYGSITECTFIVSGLTSEQKRDGTAPSDGQGGWVCTTQPTDGHVKGYKNYILLECDKFGEFSHASSTGS